MTVFIMTISVFRGPENERGGGGGGGGEGGGGEGGEKEGVH